MKHPQTIFLRSFNLYYIHILFSKAIKGTKIIFSTSIISFLLVVSIGCKPNGKDENNDLQTLVYLGIVSNTCNTVESCFQRFARTADEGASLIVIDKNNNEIYNLESGNIANDKHQIIFSGSKWVTAVIIQRAIQSGTCNRISAGGTFSPSLNLDTTTGTVLGWTVRNTITMRQLLAFTSGLDDNSGASGQDPCLVAIPNNATNADKIACAESIRDNTAQNPPGAAFVYNSNHMAIAQRMAEVACNKTWTEIYRDEVITPLGFDSAKSFWYSNLGEAIAGNPTGDGSLAGAYGLVTSPREYSRILLALLREGTGFNGSADVAGYLTSARVTEILADQSENSRIGFSQFAAFGSEWKYGLGNWRDCSNPNDVSKCEEDLISHSIGGNGFYPWLDRNRGYIGIVAANNLGRKGGLTNLPSTVNSLFFGETIRPLIHQRLNLAQ